MSEAKTKSIQVGPGLPTLLTVLFVALKLLGYIPWLSWWWVFSPIWIPFALTLAILGVVLFGVIIVAVIGSLISRR